MKIGSYQLANPVIAAPMAGVSDKPYRKLCRYYGAGMTVSEMVTSRADLRDSVKSRFRMDLQGEPEPVVVQIVGTEPAMMATAARHNVANGAQIIDINMGCPAKKVCKKAAGSALLENEPLVAEILRTVVAAVAVPVTLKIRTGATPDTRNAVTIAQIAEDAGVACLTVHGRTRKCKFVGDIDYDTIAEVKRAVSIPVIANGDIDSPQTARWVQQYTGADAVMIGRAAQGRPWLFQQVADFLESGVLTPAPGVEQRASAILSHLSEIHQFYGAALGVRLARKHIKWYLQHWGLEMKSSLRSQINATEEAAQQYQLMHQFLTASLAGSLCLMAA